MEINKNINFLQTIPKNLILDFLNDFDILVGEFYEHNISIGASGIEALVLNKPFINGGSGKTKNGKFLHTIPPVYYANSENEIMNILESLIIYQNDYLLIDRKKFIEKILNNSLLIRWLSFV